MKRKEIKFQRFGSEYQGRQNGIVYALLGERLTSDRQIYTVLITEDRLQGRKITTAGHRAFTLEGAKEFCQMFADGEITFGQLRAMYDAENAAKEQEAIRDATERAKAFRDKLEAVGISYSTMLDLEAMSRNLGNIGHNILLGWEHGEGLPNG
ncbi:MAG: hypothetical protein PHD67_08760 [Oscillospiraceae bacterium]|nr:hypothetical protein [Oscillospiraceae bacterium]